MKKSVTVWKYDCYINPTKQTKNSSFFLHLIVLKYKMKVIFTLQCSHAFLVGSHDILLQKMLVKWGALLFVRYYFFWTSWEGKNHEFKCSAKNIFPINWHAYLWNHKIKPYSIKLGSWYMYSVSLPGIICVKVKICNVIADKATIFKRTKDVYVNNNRSPYGLWQWVKSS